MSYQLMRFNGNQNWCRRIDVVSFRRNKMYSQFCKRPLDILLASIGFVLLFPIFIIGTLLLCYANMGNPFFLQPRPGRHGKIFKVITENLGYIFKFRSELENEELEEAFRGGGLSITKI